MNDEKHRHNFVGLPDDGWYSPPEDQSALFGEGTSLLLGQLRHAHDGLEVHLHYQHGRAKEPLSGNGPSLYVFGSVYEEVNLQEGRY